MVGPPGQHDSPYPALAHPLEVFGTLFLDLAFNSGILFPRRVQRPLHLFFGDIPIGERLAQVLGQVLAVA